MLQHCKISGFGDEISNNVEEQIEVLNQLGQKYIEFRGGDGKNIADYTIEEAMVLKEKLERGGIKVSSIGSPIGKIKITDDFITHFKSFKHVVELAKVLDTKYIRMFSFYVDKGEEESYKEEVYRRLSLFIHYAKEHNIILLHENEKGIYGDTGARCKELMDNLYGDHFKMLFDFANFVQCNEDTSEVYHMLKPYIHYIHIKDALKESHEVVPAGVGDGNLKDILGDLHKYGYSGYLSLEPHLAVFQGFHQLEEMDGNQEHNLKLVSYIKSCNSIGRGIDNKEEIKPYEIAYYALQGLLQEI